MFAPLSLKQLRENAKFQSKEARENAKMESDENRKQQLQQIKLQEAAAKAKQGLSHKEDIHAAKMKEMGAPLSKPKKLNKQKLGIPSQNVFAGLGVLGQGQKKLYAEGTDTVPAMLTPGEAVIPAPAAQDPANKPIIKQMIEEGREANADAKESSQPTAFSNGTRKVPSMQQQMFGNIPKVSAIKPARRPSKMHYYADGTAGVGFMDDLMEGLRKVAPGIGMMVDKVQGVTQGVPGSIPELPQIPVEIVSQPQPVQPPAPPRNYIANTTNPVAAANTGAALAIDPRLVSQNEMANENARLAAKAPVVAAPLAAVAPPAEKQNDASALADDFFRRASWAEAGNDPNARQSQPGQTASGLTGTTKGTFRLLQAKYPELQGVEFNSPQYVDPKFQKVLSDVHVKDRIPQITAKGLPVDNNSLYAAGFGPRGISAFAAKADEPLSKHFNAEELKQNPYFGKTAGDFQTFIKKKMDKAGERLGKYETSQETTKLNNLSVSPPRAPANEVPKPTDSEPPKAEAPVMPVQEQNAAIATVAQENHAALDAKVAEIMAKPDATPEQKKQEATSLVEKVYGDKGIFNQSDLLRFAITAAGGMLTGGSAAGSLRFAARDMLQQSDQRHKETVAAERQAKTIEAQDIRQQRSLDAQERNADRRMLNQHRLSVLAAQNADDRTMRTAMVKEGVPYAEADAWIKSGRKGDVPKPTLTFTRTGNQELVTLTQPTKVGGKVFQPGEPVYQYQVKDSRGNISTRVKAGGREFTMDEAADNGIYFTKWDEGKHGSKAQVEDLIKWTDNSAKTIDSIMQNELGADNIKGKINPQRQGQFTPGEGSEQAKSWALSKKYVINDPQSKNELDKITSIAVRQAVRDAKAGSKVSDLTPYLNASYIIKKNGLSEDLFTLDPKKGTQMKPEKIIELQAKAVQAGMKTEAEQSAQLQKLATIWKANADNIQKKYGDRSDSETGFYMFAADVLKREANKKK